MTISYIIHKWEYVHKGRKGEKNVAHPYLTRVHVVLPSAYGTNELMSIAKLYKLVHNIFYMLALKVVTHKLGGKKKFI